MTPDDPLGAEEFARAMAAFAPFEPRPRLAVAVSGGADSLALALLAEGWARQRGGSVLALTVDHRLRLDSTAEAERVGQILATRSIAHAILPWRTEKPRHGVQAAAREARYRLLGEACRTAGVLHLLLGHHQDDQAETLALRREAGSGPEGLAGMAALRETDWGRLLRPLLEVPATRLRATLRTLDQPWISDPSNRDRSFTRVRLRQDLSNGEKQDLLHACRASARQRRQGETDCARLLAAACRLFPTGQAWVSAGPWNAAPLAVRRQALSRLLMTVGGRAYPPASQGLERLLKQGGTLGGCRIQHKGQAGFWAFREVGRGRPETVSVGPGPLFWDGRFRLHLEGPEATPDPWRVAPLGQSGWNRLRAERPDGHRRMGLQAAALSLPALWRGDDLSAVPSLGFGDFAGPGNGLRVASCVFAPRSALSPGGFFLASGAFRTISYP
ncbi:tRNA lysidine(34) synthetase TilS [Magnetospira thiophila]